MTKEKRSRRSVAGIDQDELVDPSKLADADSSFLDFKGVQIHHKLYEHHEDPAALNHTPSVPGDHHQANRVGFPIVLLHGFGASLFSWERSMRPLARTTSSKVVAFDRPAFGLTSRLMVVTDKDIHSLNPYSSAFSALATLSFVDLLAEDKAILMGHSAGCHIAVNAYFEDPKRVAALILVSPAVLAPFPPSNHDEGNIICFKLMLSRFSMYVKRSRLRMLTWMVNMIVSINKGQLTRFLRSTAALMLVRIMIDKFGIAAIRHGWYDANLITDHVLDGYKKPLKSKNWDRALLEYILATLTEFTSRPPLSKRLEDISCPVLIITGDSDRTTPAWNADRLSQAIPGSRLAIIENCGHLPHEEKAEEFVSVVQKFLLEALGAQKEQHTASHIVRLGAGL